MDLAFEEIIGFAAELNDKGVFVGNHLGFGGFERWFLHFGNVDKPEVPEFDDAVMLHLIQVNRIMFPGGKPFQFFRRNHQPAQEAQPKNHGEQAQRDQNHEKHKKVEFTHQPNGQKYRQGEHRGHIQENDGFVEGECAFHARKDRNIRQPRWNLIGSRNEGRGASVKIS